MLIYRQKDKGHEEVRSGRSREYRGAHRTNGAQPRHTLHPHSPRYIRRPLVPLSFSPLPSQTLKVIRRDGRWRNIGGSRPMHATLDEMSHTAVTQTQVHPYARPI